MSKIYTDEYKNTIVELYNSGKTLAELNSEYGLPKSTILTWVNKAKPIAIDDNKIIHSFSGKGNPYDNACIESFHLVLKKEEVNLVKYFDFDAARLAIFEYIESWYNSERIHSSLGYITPQEWEDKSKRVA